MVLEGVHESAQALDNLCRGGEHIRVRKVVNHPSSPDLDRGELLGLVRDPLGNLANDLRVRDEGVGVNHQLSLVKIGVCHLRHGDA